MDLKVLVCGNAIFAGDMAWGFRQAGCEVRCIDAVPAARLDEILGEMNPELLVTLGAPLEFEGGALDYIGNMPRTGIKHIHWDTDGITSRYIRSVSGDGAEMDIIYRTRPDFVLTMCPEMLEFIRGKGFLCEMMHYAYSPVSHYPIETVSEKGNEKTDINLVGTAYAWIARYHPEHYRYKSLGILLKPLLENDYAVQFYGDEEYRPLVRSLFGIDVPEGYFHGYVDYEKTNAVYNSAFINLVTQNHDRTITKRTFEILGSGSFALSSDNSELRKLFTPGKDLAVSSSPEQTLELTAYYQAHPDEYRQVRKNAALSVQNHTYKQRAEFILGKYEELA